MASSREQALKNLALAHASPDIGRPLGVKNKATLKFEELRANFNERVMEKWEVLIDAQLKDSLRNYKARHYTFDQTIGKPKETIELNGDINLKLDV